MFSTSESESEVRRINLSYNSASSSCIVTSPHYAPLPWSHPTLSSYLLSHTDCKHLLFSFPSSSTSDASQRSEFHKNKFEFNKLWQIILFQMEIKVIAYANIYLKFLRYSSNYLYIVKEIIYLWLSFYQLLVQQTSISWLKNKKT